MNDIDQGRQIELSGSLRKPMGWLIALMVIPFVAAMVAIFAAVQKVPAEGKPAMWGGIAVFGVVTVILFPLLILSMRRIGVRVDQSQLVLNTGLGTKRIALSNLRAHGLSVVDLNERSDLRPILRLWGSTFPGFSSGWFRLRNGEKAVCLLFDRRSVSYLRSDADKTSLLLSLHDPEKLRALLGRN
jgi:Bacterial PH domain